MHARFVIAENPHGSKERERETKRGQFKNKVAHMERHENAGERIYAWRQRNAGKDDVLSLSLPDFFPLALSFVFDGRK